jgi:hypothetical protein
MEALLFHSTLNLDVVRLDLRPSLITQIVSQTSNPRRQSLRVVLIHKSQDFLQKHDSLSRQKWVVALIEKPHPILINPDHKWLRVLTEE